MDEAILKNIGGTPIAELENPTKNKKVRVYAKLEWHNLSGSIKDRAALSMILDGEKTGKLTPEKTVIESTSGNTGIALAVISKVKGYKLKLFMPGNASEERKKLLRQLGAELVLTDPLKGPDGAYEKSKKTYEENPGSYFKPDQYSNPANPLAHEKTTAKEIWAQTDGKITHFIAGTGTSGTLVGTGRKLKQLNQNIKVIAVEPEEELHGIEGTKNMRVEMVPGIYDESIIDEKILIKTEEAYDTAVKLAKNERLFAGFSSGLNVTAAFRLAETLDKGVIVTVLPDSGYRYLSNKIYPDDIFDVEVNKKTLEEIKQHAKKSYPNEACGLLIGKKTGDLKTITRAAPVENTSKDRGRDRYEINPKEYIKADKTLSEGEIIMGVYHSHPDHPPRPSETDLERAQPEYSYMILATVGDTVTAVTSWTLNEETKKFEEEFINTK